MCTVQVAYSYYVITLLGCFAHITVFSEFNTVLVGKTCHRLQLLAWHFRASEYCLGADSQIYRS